MLSECLSIAKFVYLYIWLSCFIKVFMSSTSLITLLLELLYGTQASAVMKNIQLACEWVEESQQYLGSLPIHFSKSRGHGTFLAGSTRQKKNLCVLFAQP